MTALTIDSTPALRRRPIPRSEPRPALRIVPDVPTRVPAAQGVLALAGGDRTATAATAPGDSIAEPPPAGPWTRQFVQAALEVSIGRRPAGQLVRWTTEEVFAMLSRRGALAKRIERPGGVTAATMVRSVHLCQPADGIVEANAVVVDRGRVRAVALRLEELAGRWRVCALEIG